MRSPTNVKPFTRAKSAPPPEVVPQTVEVAGVPEGETPPVESHDPSAPQEIEEDTPISEIKNHPPTDPPPATTGRSLFANLRKPQNNGS